MKIYIDNDFKCHAQNDGTMREVETDFFNGKSSYFIESYRFIPSGEKWVNPVGIIFRGEMISPWRDYSIAETAQNAYEEGIVTGEEESAEIIGIIEGSVGV